MDISLAKFGDYGTALDLSHIQSDRQGKMLEDVAGMYSSVFGTKAGPDREKHPVVFLPDGSKKACKPSGQMSSMGYLSFVVPVINSVINAANNINNNNSNNNNNDNNNNKNNVNIQNSNNNLNNTNMVEAGRNIPIEKVLSLQNRLARHHKESQRKVLNQTIINILDFDPFTREQFNRTVILPLQPQLNRKPKQQNKKKDDFSNGFTDIFKHAVGKYFPTFMRKKRSTTTQEKTVCNLSTEGNIMVSQCLHAAQIIIPLWVEVENSKVRKNQKDIIKYNKTKSNVYTFTTGSAILQTTMYSCIQSSQGWKMGKDDC